tara:strand:+ start:700 stop:2040 length:1341 start_codon:yes stop_codon:yes gene_type:complete
VIKLNLGKKKKYSDAQMRYLSQAIQLEESVNPKIVRTTMTMVSCTIIVFLIWAALTNINEVARTPGEVVPHGYQQTVQHLEGGIVKEIFVNDGQMVVQGQELLKLDGASLKEDLDRALSKQFDLDMRAERLRAFIEERELNFAEDNNAAASVIADQKAYFKGMKTARTQEQKIVEEQIQEKLQSIKSLETDLETASKNLKIAQDLQSKRLKLNEKGYASKMQILEDEKQVNELQGTIKRLKNQILVAKSEIRNSKNKLSSVVASHRDEAFKELSLIMAEKTQNVNVIRKIEERISRLTIKSPVKGLVKGLTVNTIGAVVQSGQVIMEIIPLDKSLEVAVKISPQDIGHLELGQPVQVKFSTYDFSRYGSVQGQLEYISATTFTGDKGERYYQGRVTLGQAFVGQNPDNVILPGMTVMADVITGEKTILQYLLKPIHLSIKTAFTER